MTNIKVTACYWDDDKGKRHHGLYILNRKTNTYVILNKNLEKVPGVTTFVTLEQEKGNIYFNFK